VPTVLRAYLRLALFAVGLLAGIQVPGFADQYAKRVSAHYIEVTKNFAGFEHTADQYFGGSIDALLAHHESSTDSVFKDEAKSIRAMYARLQSLTLELAAMNQSMLSRILHVAFRPDKEILNETLSAYSYTVPLSPDAILCGVGTGLLLALAIELILVGLTRSAQAMLARAHTAASTTAARRRY
jgi:hypothetical protein